MLINHFWRIKLLWDNESNRYSGSQTYGGKSLKYATVGRLMSGIELHYTIGKSENVNITAYDATGRRVALLYSGQLRAGTNRLMWNPGAAGVYFIVIDNLAGRTKFKFVVR
jgi:hypothetical protein